MRRFFRASLLPLFLLAPLFSQNTYLGPIQPIPGNPQLVRVEVEVYDSPEKGGVTIASASFNGEEVPLKPPDIHGFRGGASFQLAPGKYKLRWKVQRDQVTWPRVIPHEEIAFLDAKDTWVQITIEGDSAKIQ